MRSTTRRPTRSGIAASGRRFVLYQYVPFLMSRATGILAREMHWRVEQFGLEILEWRILVTAESQGEMSIKELADCVMEPQPTVSRWVDKMERKGLLERASSSSDGRVSIVKLTSLGRGKAVEISRIAMEHEQESLAALQPHERITLRHLLERLVLSLEAKDLTDVSRAEDASEVFPV